MGARVTREILKPIPSACEGVWIVVECVLSASLNDVLMWLLTRVRVGPLVLGLLGMAVRRGARNLYHGFRRRCSWNWAGEEPPNLPGAPSTRTAEFWRPVTPPPQTRGSHFVDIRPPVCPKCGGGMTLREGRVNRTLFWGCVRFRTGKHCDGTRDASVEILVCYC